MNISKLIIVSIAALVMTTSAEARDDRNKYEIQSLLDSEKAKKALLDVPLYFAENSPTKFESNYGEVSTNKKTNAFMKSDLEACEWAMLSALKALQERAIREGMTDVVNITSNYKNKRYFFIFTISYFKRSYVHYYFICKSQRHLVY